MRIQRFYWALMVLGIVGVAYGSSLLIYNFNRGNGLNIPALLFLILGILCLLFFTILAIFFRVSRKKNIETVKDEKEELIIEPDEEVEETPISIAEPKPAIEPKQDEIEEENDEEVPYEPRQQRTYSSSSSYSYSMVYVKKVGYGPVLRVEGSRIIDMRTNTYYRIENNIVMQDGYGPRYEIRGNQIRDVFGGYLYEISGSNINKVFGGFYASISGSYITLYNLSEKYELTDSLSRNQLLAVAALLFGKY